MIEIEHLNLIQFQSYIEDLTVLLQSCVNDGASIGFLRPLEYETAKNYWLQNFESFSTTGRHLIIAKLNARIIGSVQLIEIQIPNQPHRAEISKFIINPNFRRLGVGKLLMSNIEELAVRLNRNLLTLDTAGLIAAKFYENQGFIKAGSIPNFALDVDGKLECNYYYFKQLQFSYNKNS